MSIYKLHKLPEGFIITSNEEIKEGDFVYSKDSETIDKTKGFFICHQIEHELNVPATRFEGKDYFNELQRLKKVIAQQHQIDFSALPEDDYKKIGWFLT